MNSTPVLLYHHVCDDREVTPAGFLRHLEYLKGAGYRSVFLDELPCFTGRNEKTVAITFDDGFLDNWVYAFPSLKKTGMKATIFVSTFFIGSGRPRKTSEEESGIVLDTLHGEKDKKNFLNWSELKIMADSGLVDVQSHTHTHKYFDKRAAYADIYFEMSESKRLIEANLGRRCRFIAWPWGRYEHGWIETAQKNGYDGCATTKVGANSAGSDPYRIKRFKVEKEDSGWFANRVGLCGRKMLVGMYGAVFGLDRKIKRFFR